MRAIEPSKRGPRNENGTTRLWILIVVAASIVPVVLLADDMDCFAIRRPTYCSDNTDSSNILCNKDPDQGCILSTGGKSTCGGTKHDNNPCGSTCDTSPQYPTGVQEDKVKSHRNYAATGTQTSGIPSCSNPAPTNPDGSFNPNYPNGCDSDCGVMASTTISSLFEAWCEVTPDGCKKVGTFE